jgi:transposase-like protein
VPLVDLSMVEQRYDAVREVLDGASVKDTAIRYGVDRRTLHRWLVRYANQGLAALADQSSRPASSSCDDPTPAGVRARSSTSCAKSSRPRRPVRRSIAASCATG